METELSRPSTPASAGLNLRTRLASLVKLRDAWSKTRQSKGGIVALRGFHFQMLTALARLISKWLNADALQQNDPHLIPIWIEALSDWTEVDGPAIVACQEIGRASPRE